MIITCEIWVLIFNDIVMVTETDSPHKKVGYQIVYKVNLFERIVVCLS